ncbi:hypothetical protein DL93DRAFT_1878077 [Clavulina sp. PMI_390]|nr:hypothetical protein DL93DRAFT_1878077 [Clavulina sp. PMI_390]
MTPPIPTLSTLAREHVLPREILKDPQPYFASASASTSTAPDATEAKKKEESGEGGETIDEDKPKPDGEEADAEAKNADAEEQEKQQQDQAKYRFKVEYVPIARKMDTYGGRRLSELDKVVGEVRGGSGRRQVRETSELGPVEIETLTLCLSSGLGPEISYALTTLTMLSTLPGGPSAIGGPPNLGYPLEKCEDLLEVIVDLLEESAFPGDSTLYDDNDDDDDDDGGWGIEGEGDKDEDKDEPLWTRAELLRQIEDDMMSPFASRRGAGHRPAADTILTILNLLRNLCGHEQNPGFMARNPRLLDVLGRVCAVIPAEGSQEQGTTRLRPLSRELTLQDLPKIHSDTVSLVGMLDMQRMKLSSASTYSAIGVAQPSNKRLRKTTRRLYALLTSPLLDQAELDAGKLAPRNVISYPPHPVPFPPSSQVQNQPPEATVTMKVTPGIGPPRLNHTIDSALDAFAKLAVRDSNRHALAQYVPAERLTRHFEVLVRMLPVTDADFESTTPVLSAGGVGIGGVMGGSGNMGAHSLAMETVIGYLERVMHSLHSLVFLAPPSLKREWKAQYGRALAGTCVRAAQYWLGGVRRSDGLVFVDGSAGGGRGAGAGPGMMGVGGVGGWMVVVRRMWEMLGLLDAGVDAFEPVPEIPLAFAPPPAGGSTSTSTAASSGDHHEYGLLSARFSETLVTLLMRETNDDVAFRELESLIRLGGLSASASSSASAEVEADGGPGLGSGPGFGFGAPAGQAGRATRVGMGMGMGMGAAVSAVA